MSLTVSPLNTPVISPDAKDGAADTAGDALAFLTELDLAELTEATGAHLAGGRVLTHSGRPADAATTALFQGIAAVRQAEALTGTSTGVLSEYSLLQVKKGAYGDLPDIDPDQVDRLLGEIRRDTQLEHQSVGKDEFLKWMKQSPEERALEAWLARHKLTLDQFKALPKEEQQALLDKFKDDMKKEQEAKYGVGMTIDALT